MCCAGTRSRSTEDVASALVEPIRRWTLPHLGPEKLAFSRTICSTWRGIVDEETGELWKTAVSELLLPGAPGRRCTAQSNRPIQPPQGCPRQHPLPPSWRYAPPQMAVIPPEGLQTLPQRWHPDPVRGGCHARAGGSPSPTPLDRHVTRLHEQAAASATRLSYVHAADPGRVIFSREIPPQARPVGSPVPLAKHDIIPDAGKGARFAWRSSPHNFTLTRVTDLQDYAQIQCPNEHPSWGLSWSPDDNHIVKWARPSRDAAQSRYSPSDSPVCLSIHSAATGTRMHRVTLQHPIEVLEWSPDGLQLAFWGEPAGMGINADHKAEVVFLDVVAGQVLVWSGPGSANPLWEVCHCLKWSETSQWLVASVGMEDDQQEHPGWDDPEDLHYDAFGDHPMTQHCHVIDACNGEILSSSEGHVEDDFDRLDWQMSACTLFEHESMTLVQLNPGSEPGLVEHLSPALRPNRPGISEFTSERLADLADPQNHQEKSSALTHVILDGLKVHIVASGSIAKFHGMMKNIKWLPHALPEQLVYAWMTPLGDLMLVDATRHEVLMDMPYKSLIGKSFPGAAPAVWDISGRPAIEHMVKYNAAVLEWSPDGFHLMVVGQPYRIVLSFN
ncbi:hypothetical protein WJX74_008304 [Apatococcus lobatus]|uniref:F-box domain-containing protein n=1 Tax=Apatococcus lobatus TaxID=904363 RepID=A0AAW1QUA5_9CHLO